MNELTIDESRAFLRALFPDGLRDPRVLEELCPEGWGKSALFAAFHPPLETSYREYLQLQENMRSLDRGARRRKGTPPPPEEELDEEPDLSFDEFKHKFGTDWAERGREVDPVEEPAELLGLCLWDVFSDNHSVIAADGREVSLGSFRGTAGEIAEFMDVRPCRTDEAGNRRGRSGHDYMDFYMGTIWVQGRTDLGPVYRLIFRRLKDQGADWKYSFPRLRLFSPEEIAENLGIPYDPSAALEREQQRAERERETRRMQQRLDQGTLAAQREARAKPPPDTVRAYQEIYGRFPSGWPPDPYRVD